MTKRELQRKGGNQKRIRNPKATKRENKEHSVSNPINCDHYEQTDTSFSHKASQTSTPWRRRQGVEEAVNSFIIVPLPFKQLIALQQ
jgi:hypothetical protein